jgi:hypothetical protein
MDIANQLSQACTETAPPAVLPAIGEGTVFDPFPGNLHALLVTTAAGFPLLLQAIEYV